LKGQGVASTIQPQQDGASPDQTTSSSDLRPAALAPDRALAPPGPEQRAAMEQGFLGRLADAVDAGPEDDPAGRILAALARTALDPYTSVRHAVTVAVVAASHPELDTAEVCRVAADGFDARSEAASERARALIDAAETAEYDTAEQAEGEASRG
jgi:hypothetical protein